METCDNIVAVSKINMNKYIHYTFSTYKRGQILVDGIADELRTVFDEISNEKGFKIICHSILADHVHMLVEKKPFDRNEYIMKMIKGISANYIFSKYKINRFVFRKLWSRGYRAYELIDEISRQRAADYIHDQKINGIDKRSQEAATFSRRLPN